MQVSVAGRVADVELARHELRRLAPLSVTFGLDQHLLKPGTRIDELIVQSPLEIVSIYANFSI